MRVFSFLVWCALVTPAFAADPPEQIRVPDAPVQITQPDALMKLSGDVLFVIDSDVDVMVLDSPRGHVKVTREKGPLRIRAKFIDNPDEYETREYKGKEIIFVEPEKVGITEIFVIPIGEKDESKVIRRMVHVVKEQDCPDPKEPDKPDPKEPDNPLVDKNLLSLLQLEYDKAKDPESLEKFANAMAAAAFTFSDPQYKTLGEAEDAVTIQTIGMMKKPDGTIPFADTLGAIVGRYLAPRVDPPRDMVLTPEIRKDISNKYKIVSETLREVKP